MRDQAWLHAIRYAEMQVWGHLIGDGNRVLEIGGGTGYQASVLSKRGVSVVSVDVAGSCYRNDRIHRIVEYDGRTLPFPDKVFDKVFTSDCLEHVVSLSRLHDEMARVLRDGGSAVHVVPTPQWLLLSWLQFYPFMAHRAVGELARIVRRPSDADGRDAALPTTPPEEDMSRLLRRLPRSGPWAWPENNLPEVGVARLLRRLRSGIFPRRHGERGNVITELLYFRLTWWRRHFRQHGWTISAEFPIPFVWCGFWETPLGLSARRALASVIGPSSYVFHVSPPTDHAEISGGP